MVSPPKRTSGSKNGTFCNGSARLAHADIKLMQDCVLTTACEMLTPRLNPPQANLVSWTSITGIILKRETIVYIWEEVILTFMGTGKVIESGFGLGFDELSPLGVAIEFKMVCVDTTPSQAAIQWEESHKRSA
ncbi:hypothetical protein PanWU01x14_217520 [Parasponia andersonii]|uniref:Uncharacterized protein n=1 Tax=Parasponia andersonii TaxID=3476 RepID=A0A2P5BR56_PARAD|nr:hypothetical protein PanWU01x14_217520 [Parasponia andersonii]